MRMTLRKRLAKLFGILCVFVGQGAGAQHRTDYLSFSSALPTEVVITLSGQVFYCDPFFG
jgi:hypothetical protein